MANIANQAIVTLVNAVVSGPSGSTAVGILSDGVCDASAGLIAPTAANLEIGLAFPIPQNILNLTIWNYDNRGANLKLYADEVLVEEVTGAGISWSPTWAGDATTLTILSNIPIVEIEVQDNSISLTPFTVNADTISCVYAPIVVNADTLRQICVIVNTDTLRQTSATVTVNADTKRVLPKIITPLTIGVKSMTIQTGVQSLSDRFTIESVGQAFADTDNFKGSVAGFDFAFEKAETRESVTSMGTTYTITGRPDMNNFLFGSVYLARGSYIYNGGRVINATAKQLCSMIGVDATNITDFTPLGIGSLDEETGIFKIKEKSKKAFLDSLFGWSSEFANRQIYYTNRNGMVVVNEVGKYITTYDLDCESQYKIENSNTQRQRVRKFVDVSESTIENPSTPTTGASITTPNATNSPFSGSTSFGEASLTYAAGLLTREVTTDSTTLYTYESANSFAFNSSKKVLKTKTTMSDSNTKRSTTMYEYDIEMQGPYSSSDVDVSLTTEHTIVEINEGGAWTVDSEHRTYHVPLGNGFFGQRVVEIDGENHTTVANSISHGSAGGLASMYTVNQYNGYTLTPPDDVEKPKDLIGELRSPMNIPVAEIGIVNDLIDIINDMDKKIEENLSVTIKVKPGAQLVDAVKGVVTYKGNLYFIQSTSAVISDKGTRQQVSAVRWCAK